MVRTGEVVEKTGDILSVVFERPEACTHCNGCIKKNCTRVDIPGMADVGDTVEVEMPDKNVVGASAVAYIVPLALLIVGLFAGYALHGPLSITMDGNLFCALCGVVGLALGFLIVFAVDKTLQKRRDWQPQIVTIHKKEV